MKNAFLSIGVGSLLAGMAIVALPAPGQAQSYEPDIVVRGEYGRLPDDVQSLSESVSYDDLDLRTDYGWRELRHRVSLTARYLCDQLGESDSSDGVLPSCRDAATRDALSRVGTFQAHYAPHDTAWAPGPRWEAPYPDRWESQYP